MSVCETETETDTHTYHLVRSFCYKYHFLIKLKTYNNSTIYQQTILTYKWHAVEKDNSIYWMIYQTISILVYNLRRNHVSDFLKIHIITYR